MANVCGTCHAVFAQKFATSVHAQIFDRGCVECHGNHAVLQPTDAMLGTDAGTPCARPATTARDDKGRDGGIRECARTSSGFKAGIGRHGRCRARARTRAWR